MRSFFGLQIAEYITQGKEDGSQPNPFSLVLKYAQGNPGNRQCFSMTSAVRLSKAFFCASLIKLHP